MHLFHSYFKITLFNLKLILFVYTISSLLNFLVLSVKLYFPYYFLSLLITYLRY